jgi:hypothetical protein
MTSPQAVRVQLQLDLADVGLLERLGLTGAHIHVHPTPAPPSPETVRSFVLQQVLRLSPAESRTLLKLLERGSATRKELHEAMSPSGVPATNIKLVDVRIHKMRQKLAPHDVKIKNVWGTGYQIDQGSQARINKLLAEAEVGSVQHELLQGKKD